MKKNLVIIMTIFTWAGTAFKNFETWAKKAIANIETAIGALTDSEKKFVKNILPGVIQFLNLLKSDEPMIQSTLDGLLPTLKIPIDMIMGLGMKGLNGLLKICGHSEDVINATTDVYDAIGKVQTKLATVEGDEKVQMLTDMAVHLGTQLTPEAEMPENPETLVPLVYNELKGNLQTVPVPAAEVKSENLSKDASAAEEQSSPAEAANTEAAASENETTGGSDKSTQEQGTTPVTAEDGKEVVAATDEELAARDEAANKATIRQGLMDKIQETANELLTTHPDETVCYGTLEDGTLFFARSKNEAQMHATKMGYELVELKNTKGSPESSADSAESTKA